MRPCDRILRQRYQAAAKELRALGKPVTPRTLSAHLSKNYHSVRTFFHRNPAIARKIGIETVTRHSKEEYASAKAELTKADTSPTTREIASKMGKSHSSVVRALREKPTPVQAEAAPSPEPAIPIPEAPAAPEKPAYVPVWVSTMRRTREITVQHFDSRSLRIILNKVGPHKYIQLWDAGHLDFQVKGQPIPEHLPTREEIAVFIS